MTSNMTEGHASRRARASRGKQELRLVVPAPVAVVKADPLAWAYALKVAKDPKRLTVEPDGSVVIHNHPVR